MFVYLKKFVLREKLIVFLFLVIFSFVLFIFTANAQSLVDYKNSVLDIHLEIGGDDRIDVIVAQLADKQNGFFALEGRYWQGAKVFDSVPMGLMNPDFRRKVSSEYFDWVDMGFSNVDFVRFNQWVDIYESPVGHGYTLTLEVENGDGAIFRKVVNFGNESFRSKNWFVVLPIER